MKFALRRLRWMFFFIIVLNSIGCTSKYCGYPTGCWQGYFRETCSGTYTVSMCGKLCNACTFNEPSCMACWECMKHDGCGYGLGSGGNILYRMPSQSICYLRS